jgi:hypothetical protein
VIQALLRSPKRALPGELVVTHQPGGQVLEAQAPRGERRRATVSGFALADFQQAERFAPGFHPHRLPASLAGNLVD